MLVTIISLLNVLPLSIAILVCQFITVTYLALKPNYRNEIEYNYKKVFRQTKKYFWIKNGLAVGKNLAMMVKYKNKDLDRVEIEGENIMKDIMKKNSCIAVSFHCGLWELLPQVFARRGYNIFLNVQEQRNSRLNRYLENWRSKNGVKLINNLKMLRDAIILKLHTSSLIGFVLDNTHYAEFNNNSDFPFPLLTVPFIIAKRYSLPIVPIFNFTHENKVKALVGSVCYPASNDNLEQNIIEQFLSILKKYPEQWVFWGKQKNQI